MPVVISTRSVAMDSVIDRVVATTGTTPHRVRPLRLIHRISPGESCSDPENALLPVDLHRASHDTLPVDLVSPRVRESTEKRAMTAVSVALLT